MVQTWSQYSQYFFNKLMNIGLVTVTSPDCWRERLLGTSTKLGRKVLNTELQHNVIFIFLKHSGFNDLLTQCTELEWYETVLSIDKQFTGLPPSPSLPPLDHHSWLADVTFHKWMVLTFSLKWLFREYCGSGPRILKDSCEKDTGEQHIRCNYEMNATCRKMTHKGRIYSFHYVVCISCCLCVVQLSSCWAIIMEHMISMGATNMVHFLRK
jgi:hypothetical protein